MKLHVNARFKLWNREILNWFTNLKTRYKGIFKVLLFSENCIKVKWDLKTKFYVTLLCLCFSICNCQAFSKLVSSYCRRHHGILVNRRLTLNLNNNNIIIIFSFNIQSDIPHADCLQVNYEQMIESYYRSRTKPQGSHARLHIMAPRQLRLKDMPKVPTLRLEWGSNLRLCECKAPNLPLSHHTPY